MIYYANKTLSIIWNIGHIFFDVVSELAGFIKPFSTVSDMIREATEESFFPSSNRSRTDKGRRQTKLPTSLNRKPQVLVIQLLPD